MSAEAYPRPRARPRVWPRFVGARSVARAASEVRHVDVLVTGSSGFIGTALLPVLERSGHRPVRLVRGAAGTDTGTGAAATLRWDPAAGTIDAAGLEGIDAVVHLAGESIGATRSGLPSRSSEFSRAVLEARRCLRETLAGLRRRRPYSCRHRRSATTATEATRS